MRTFPSTLVHWIRKCCYNRHTCVKNGYRHIVWTVIEFKNAVYRTSMAAACVDWKVYFLLVKLILFDILAPLQTALTMWNCIYHSHIHGDITVRVFLITYIIWFKKKNHKASIAAGNIRGCLSRVKVNRSKVSSI